jgi:hypothetical protein
VGAKELFDPEVMRGRGYKYFREYGENYVTAADTYLRPTIDADRLRRIGQMLFPDQCVERSSATEASSRDEAPSDTAPGAR